MKKYYKVVLCVNNKVWSISKFNWNAHSIEYKLNEWATPNH